MNREQWLEAATKLVRPHFEASDYQLPEKLRVSCGWPTRGGLSEKKRVVGQCFAPACSYGEVTEVFISPYLSAPVAVLETLVHELIHAAIGCDKKHGKEFRGAMKDLGLVGRPTATLAGDELRPMLEKLAEELGDYPHQALIGKSDGADGPKKQKGRQLKVSCDRVNDHEDGEEYILRAARKTIERGIPQCPLCGSDMQADLGDEKESEDA